MKINMNDPHISVNISIIEKAAIIKQVAKLNKNSPIPKETISTYVRELIRKDLSL